MQSLVVTSQSEDLFQLDAYRPANAKELFNLRHSTLCNAIERIFGVFKKRFRLLRCFDIQTYPYDTQVKCILSLGALHNFIRTWDPTDLADDLEDDSDSDSDIDDRIQPLQYSPPEIVAGTSNAAADRVINEWRDSIAEAMWNDYVN